MPPNDMGDGPPDMAWLAWILDDDGKSPPDIAAWIAGRLAKGDGAQDEALAAIPVAVWRRATPWRRGAPGTAWRWLRGRMLAVSENCLICVDGAQVRGWTAAVGGITLMDRDGRVLFESEAQACDAADTAAQPGEHLNGEMP